MKSLFNVDARAPSIPLLNFPFKQFISSVESKRVVMLFKDVLLRTRRVLLLYNVNGNNALVVLSRTLFKSINALLGLSERY